MAYHIPHYH